MSKKDARPPVAAPTNTWTGQWLRRTRNTLDPAGKLIAAMQRDAAIPTSFANIKDMRAYVQKAYPEMVAEVPVAWRRYVDWSTHNPGRPPSENS